MKTLVNKEAQQVTFADERFYSGDGGKTWFPSVTTYLEAFYKGGQYIHWLKQEGMNADRIMREAGELGDTVHKAIELLLNGNTIEWDGENYSERAWIMINRFMELSGYIDKIIETELSMVSVKNRAGGTLDLICTINGERWLIDHKTSKSIWHTHKVQLAAYKAMYEDEIGKKIDRVGILHLNAKTRGEDKKGKSIQGKGWKLVDIEEGDDINLLLEDFESAKHQWNRVNPNAKPKNLIYPTKLKLKLWEN